MLGLILQVLGVVCLGLCAAGVNAPRIHLGWAGLTLLYAVPLLLR